MRGWRYFYCDDCKIPFRETCRDTQTQSLVTCCNCSEVCYPEWAHEDSKLQVDERGNLLYEKMETL